VKLSGADLIVRLLERQGISTLAGVPGGANLPLYDALARRGRLRHVLARHEQGAGFVAQGLARVLGTPQVCLATSGPGATNVLTAVADARLDSVPLVCITGQVPLALIGTDAFQEVDTYGLSIPITKHNYLVRSAGELLEVVPDAFRVAASGRPGPVLIDVPRDVQTQELTFTTWPDPGRPDDPPRPEEADLRAAAELLNAARRPILYLGGGVIHSGAAAESVALAEKAGLPTTATLMAMGGMPTDHPLYLGMLGMHAARYTNLALEECDLLLAAGARFDDRATGKVAQFCPRAKVIHIDIDRSELGKIRQPQVGIQGDVGEVLRALVPRVRHSLRPDWRARVEELRQQFPLHMPGADDPRTPYGVILHAAALAGADAIVTTDVGQHQMWVAQAYPFRRPRAWLTSGGLGTMGFGLPAAVGAALACPDRTVVCFSGDGSLLMNIQELAVAAEENVNVKVVLLNNNSLGLVRQQQELFFGKRVYAADSRTRIDFVRIAEGFGVPAYDLGEGDPAETLTRAFAEPGPSLIHVPIRPEEKVYPMVPPGAANRDMIGGETRAYACC
jgi:acetolactate synthase-1/2/3 large subunit